MSTTIDILELEIQSNSQSATDGLDALSASLGRLKAATKGGAGLTAVATQLGKMNTALSGVSSASVANLNAMAQGLKALSSVGNLKLSSTIATQINGIGAATKSLSGIDFTPLSRLATALIPLSSIGKTNLSSTINQLQRIPALVTQLASTNIGGFAGQIQSLVSALVPLSSIGKSNLGSTLNQLAKLPQIAAQLAGMDMGAFATQIQRVVTVLTPLGTQMNKIAAGFAALPSRIQRVIQSTDRLSTSNRRAGASYGSLGSVLSSFIGKITLAVVAIKRIARVIGSWITEANAYIENLNLFTVAMGDFASEAQAYAEKVGEIMGIDPSEWMRNQGIFMTLATGFGVTADRAALMSKNLTQLGYDLSSFFNISYEDAMQKLQSGLSGELEPLRRLGYDLSQAKLQAIALSLGIDKSFTSMTQAEKAQLRYYAIMTQVTTAQGDMARTLQAPANQLRILKAQVTQCARAFGNIFIPVLNAVLPVAIAVAKVIRYVANAIAALFGFSIPKIDYSGVSGLATGADEAADAMDNATGAAKKLKSATLGFDELNVLSPDDNSGGGGGAGGGGGGFDFELPEYDFLNGLLESRTDEIVNKILAIGEELGRIFEPVTEKAKSFFQTIGAQFAAYDWASAFGDFFWTLADTIRAIFETVQTVVNPILESLNIPAVLFEALTLLTSALGALRDILDSLMPGLEAFVEKGIKPITTWVSEKVIERLQGLQEIFQKIGDWFEENSPMFTSLLDALGELLGAIWDVLQPILDVVDDAAWAILGATLVVIGEALKILVPLITLVADILTPILEIVAGILNILIGIVTLDYSQIEKGATQISDAFTTGFDDVGESASALWENITTLWNKISGWFSENVTDPLSKKWKEFKKKVDKVFKNLPKEISTMFSNLWKPIKNYDWNGLGYDIGKWFGTAVKGAIDLVTKDIPEWLSKTWKSMKEGFNTFFTQTLPTLFNEIIPGVVSDIADWFKELPTKILEAVKSAWDTVVEVGTSIIDGIFEGLATVWTAITEFIDGFIQGFKDALGIASPSTVFESIGLDIAAGLIKGILDFLGDIKEWVQIHIIDPFQEALDGALEFCVEVKNDAAQWWANVKLWWSQKVSSVQEFIANVKNTASTWWSNVTAWWNNVAAPGLHAAVSLIKSGWSTLASWIGTAVSVGISLLRSGWSSISSWIGGAVSVAVSLFKSGWSTFSSWVGGATQYISVGVSLWRNGWSSIASFIGTSVSVGISLFKSGWSSIKRFFGLADGGILGANGGVKIFGSGGYINGSSSGWWGNMPKYANGTNSAHGTMFVAGEAGPEIVGHVNGRTEVLNRSQLASTMYSAVVNGMVQLAEYWNGISQHMTVCANAIISAVTRTAAIENSSSLATAQSFVSGMGDYIGSRTAAVGDDQMVEAISLGVYQAVLNAMSGSDEDEKNIVINLDGEVIYQNQQKIARNRGYNMGMGAFTFG